MNLHRYICIFSCKAAAMIEETGLDDPQKVLRERFFGLHLVSNAERERFEFEVVHWRGTVFADILRRNEFIAGPGGLG